MAKADHSKRGRAAVRCMRLVRRPVGRDGVGRDGVWSSHYTIHYSSTTSSTSWRTREDGSVSIS